MGLNNYRQRLSSLYCRRRQDNHHCQTVCVHTLKLRYCGYIFTVQQYVVTVIFGGILKSAVKLISCADLSCSLAVQRYQ